MAEPAGVPSLPYNPYLRRLGDVPNAAQPVVYDGTPQTVSTGLAGRIGAAWRDTMLGAMLNTPTGPTYVEAGFDAVAAANGVQVPPDDRLYLSTARSRAEFDVLMAHSQQRQRDRTIAAQQPLTHMFFNVGLDPTTYMFSGATWIRAAPSFMSGTVRAGLYQGAISTTTEAIRNINDPTIPMGESTTAIIGATVLGGLVGGMTRITRPATLGVGRYLDGQQVDAAAIARGEGTRIVRPDALPGELTEDMVAAHRRVALTAEERAATTPTPSMLQRMTPEERVAWQQHGARPGAGEPPPAAARTAEALPNDVPPTIGRTPQGDDWGELPGDRTRGQGSRAQPPEGEPASVTAAKAELKAAAQAAPDAAAAARRLAEPDRATLQQSLASLTPEQVAGLSPEAKAFLAENGIVLHGPGEGPIVDRITGAIDQTLSRANKALDAASEKLFWAAVDRVSDYRKGKLNAPAAAAAAPAAAPHGPGAAAAPGAPTHAGAAATPGAQVGQSGEFQPVAAKIPIIGVNTWLERLRMSPMARLISSPIDAVGRAVSHLTEIPYFVRRNLHGLENPGNVKSDQYRWQGRLAGVIQDYNNAYLDYRGVNRLTATVQDVTRQRAPNMLSPAEFDSRVWRRLHGTVDDAIPQVNQAAKGMRELYDEMGDEAAKHAFFSQHTVRQEKVWQTTNGEVRERYVNRIWNINAIKSNLAKFTKDIEDWLSVSGGDVTKAKTIVDSILTDRPFRAIDDEHVGQASSAYKRSFNAPSTVFERWMNNDPQELLQQYVRTMGVDISLTRRAGSTSAKALIDDATEEWMLDIGKRTGRDGQKAFDELQVDLEAGRRTTQGDYAALEAKYGGHPPLEEIAKVRADGLKFKDAVMARARAALDASDKDWKHMLQDLDDIKATRDLLRGTYGQWDESMDWVPRVLASARKVAAMSSLTGVVSQLSDVGALVMKEGFTRTFGTAVSALSAGMATIKMSVKEAQSFGTCLDMMNASRVVSMMDLSSDIAGRHNMFERVLDRATQTSMYLNLMNPWSTFMKGLASMTVMSRLSDDIAAVVAGGTGQEMARLARAGISPDMAQEIHAQLQAHATRPKGVTLPNTQMWTSREAREAYGRAVAEDVENAIVSGDATSRSLYLSRPVGQTIGMFHGYGQAVLAKLIIPALQVGDTRALSGAALMIGAGMISDQLRRIATGQNQPLSYGDHLMRGIDRSGVTGWFGQLASAASSLQDVRFGPAFAGAPHEPGPNMPTATVHSSGGDGLIRLLGPAASSTANLVRLGFDTATLNWDASTARDARRLLPLNNVTHFYSIFNTLEHLTTSSGRAVPRNDRLARSQGGALSTDQRLTMSSMQATQRQAS